jgi:amidohydrolase
MPSLLDQARAIEPELVDIRRDLHQHPEIAWEEFRTGQRTADFCERLGLKVIRNAAKTGTVAVLNPDKPGPVMALRADMDALPIQEENQVPYKSTTAGKGHLCGHDAHTAMLMGAAKMLVRYKDQIPFPVRFLFQPAEEVPKGGAEVMIAEGHLNGVSEVFGLHVNPLLPCGTLGNRAGAMMASMDRIEINVEGVGGHGAMPHLSRDPVVAAAQIITALQSVVGRRIDPLESGVVSICQLDAGSAFNVIPSKVRLIGTMRSLTPEIWTALPQWIDEIASNIAKGMGCSARLDVVRGTPVLVNHAEPVEKMNRAFRRLGGSPVEVKPTMGGEDFASYLLKAPGCFAFLGAGNGTAETAQCFHHPRYNIDEKALPWGSALFTQVVLDRAGVAV